MYLDLNKKWRWHHKLVVVTGILLFFASPALVLLVTQ